MSFDEFELIKNEHLKLMRDYFKIINLVKSYPQFPVASQFLSSLKKGEYNKLSLIKEFFRISFSVINLKSDPILSNKLITLFFVEWRIRTKLTSLNKMYIQLEQSMDPLEDKSKIKWLKHVQTGTNQFLITLTIFSSLQSFIRTFITSAVALIVAILGISTVQSYVIPLLTSVFNPTIFYDILLLMIYLIVIVIYGYVIIQPSRRFANIFFTTNRLPMLEGNQSVSEIEKTLYDRLIELLIPKGTEEYYLKLLKEDPTNAIYMVNYAIFLKNVLKDYDKAEEYYKKSLELDPMNAISTGDYAIFLTKVRKDDDKAEKYYKKSLELDPTNAINTGDYAIFLTDIRKEYDKAEEYYKKSLELDPTNAINTGNYAGFLLASGQTQKGKKLLCRAFELIKESPLNEKLLLECKFYRYAHFFNDVIQIKNNYDQIISLLNRGIRSPRRNFSRNIERAKQDGHPNPELLDSLANQISKDDNLI